MVNVIGHIKERTDPDWYSLKNGKIVSVHVTDAGETFMSDSETWPSIMAEKLGIKYKLLVNATKEDALAFFEAKEIELA